MYNITSKMQILDLWEYMFTKLPQGNICIDDTNADIKNNLFVFYGIFAQGGSTTFWNVYAGQSEEISSKSSSRTRLLNYIRLQQFDNELLGTYCCSLLTLLYTSYYYNKPRLQFIRFRANSDYCLHSGAIPPLRPKPIPIPMSPVPGQFPVRSFDNVETHSTAF